MNEHWVDESQANDSDMFSGLVRQTETNNFDCVHSNTPQEHTQGDSIKQDDTIECEPSMTNLISMSTSVEPYLPSGISDGNELLIALNTLTALARERERERERFYCP